MSHCCIQFLQNVFPPKNIFFLQKNVSKCLLIIKRDLLINKGEIYDVAVTIPIYMKNKVILMQKETIYFTLPSYYSDDYKSLLIHVHQ